MPKAATSQRKFYVWFSLPSGNSCQLTYLDGIESWELHDEKPVLKTLKKKLTLEMDRERPRNVRLIDAHEEGALIVASARLRKLIEAHNPKDIEFLPVTIKNHKGRVASTEYVIVHGSKGLDCIDQKRSKPTHHFIEKKKLSEVEQLILDEARVPKGTHMFRVHNFVYPLWVVDQVLRDAIVDAKIEGVTFIRTDRWPKALDDDGDDVD
jgi:hypothetical protein